MAEERSTFHALLVAIVFAGWTIFCSLLSAPMAVFWRDRGVALVARRWARGALRVAGVQVSLSDRSGAALTPPYVVMVNHSSHADVVALYATLPIPVRFVAKRELQWVPIFGQVLRLGAAIMIDRGNRERAVASIARAGEAIRRGASVVLFPEGTRTPPGVLGPLKKGPFHLAAAARVPVLPVGVVGSAHVLPRGSWRTRPGTIEVRIGPAITPPADDSEEARGRLLADVEAALCALGELEPQQTQDSP